MFNLRLAVKNILLAKKPNLTDFPIVLERDKAIDVARGIGIILVIYAHALETSFLGLSSLNNTQFWQWQTIYSFHMPLFFIISGLTYNSKGLLKTFNNSLYLILIANFTHILGVLITFILTLKTPQIETAIFPLIMLTGYNPVVVWFLVALAFVQLIFEALVKSNNFIKILILLAMIYLFSIKPSYNFQAHILLPSLLFYTLGVVLQFTDLFNKIKFVSRIFIFAAIIATIILAPFNRGCAFNSINFCKNFYDKFGVMMINGGLGYIPLFLISALIGCFAILAISHCIASKVNIFSNFLSKIGKHTLDLFILNGFVLSFVQQHINNIFNVKETFLDSVLWALMITIMHFVILPLIRKITAPIFHWCRSLSIYLTTMVRTAASMPFS